MVKLRFVAVALLAAMASLNVGFAKIEKVPISGIVSTGALQVDLVGTTIDHDGYVTAQKSISSDGRQVTFTTNRMYPGAEVAIHIKAVNTGSRSVAFDSATLTWDGDRGLEPYFEMLSGFQFDGNGDDKVDGGRSFASSWTRLDATVATMNENSTLKSMVIKPAGAFYLGTPADGVGSAMDYPLKIRISPDAPNETQNRSVTFKLQLNWKEAGCSFSEPVVENGWLIGKEANGSQNFVAVIAKCVNGTKQTFEVKSHIQKDENYVVLILDANGEQYEVRIDRSTIEKFPMKNP